MDDLTRARLETLVRRFYHRHGMSFDASRERPWQGWDALLSYLPRDLDRPLRVLDAGCGNGRFARFLRDRDVAARVVGVDADPGLLAAARRRGGSHALAALDLAELAALRPAVFDLAVAFGVLHHVPGFAARRDLLRALGDRLVPGGRLAATAWRFDRDPGWRRRLVPWAEAAPEIDLARLEPGDHLLPWKGDRTVPRYCHLLGDAERDRLLAALPSLRPVAAWPEDRNDYFVLERRGKTVEPLRRSCVGA